MNDEKFFDKLSEKDKILDGSTYGRDFGLVCVYEMEAEFEGDRFHIKVLGYAGRFYELEREGTITFD
ncbi:hypothetical protein [Pseudalkalibacillus salsuginis]|uniref:hypothetical protein n=1 Tax=Pseudalkalibacillus salsuginis TaxID=2910972 RepID=UPI001F4076A3|nr:hypothetical protein [Pseudalkalibacillus salsuginis]MCF6411270.1 hypothetical protein [Pseudalkalibacillus salsuginis]